MGRNGPATIDVARATAEPLSGNEDPGSSVRHQSRIKGSIGRRLFMLVQFTQQSEDEGAELPVYVLYRINPYRPAENPAHIGFDRYADNLDILLCFNEGDDVAEMACGKIAYIVTSLAH